MVSTIDGRASVVLADSGDSAGKLKDKISRTVGIEPAEFQLVCAMQVIPDNARSLESIGIGDGSALTLVRVRQPSPLDDIMNDVELINAMGLELGCRRHTYLLRRDVGRRTASALKADFQASLESIRRREAARGWIAVNAVAA